MPSSIRRVTTLDHERLLRLLRRMCTPGPSQQRWREEFLGLLAAHRLAERDVVIGELVAGVAEVAQSAREQAAEDVDLDRLADRVRTLDLEQHDLPALHAEAAALLEAHARRWAERLMEPLEAVVTRGRMRSLGGAYAQRRDEELAGTGVVHPPPRRLDLSRAELYELARRKGIEGRSAMTRGQLIEELQRRSD
jgi:hypothetical protein